VVEILEQGAISFLAVPRPGGRADRGIPVVGKFLVVLAPGGKASLRRLSVRRKRLPDPARAQRFCAHVERLAPRAARLTDDLRAGARTELRVLAVGRYALARHGDHVHLAYALARACGRGRLADALGVRAAGSFLLSVFARSLPPTRAPRAARPLVPATPERLDVLGAEVALVAGARPADARLGLPPIREDRVGSALEGALLRRGPRPRLVTHG
jgi:hypothetical protein